MSSRERFTAVAAYTILFTAAGLAFFPWLKACAFGYVCGFFAGLLNSIYQEVRR